MSTLLIAATLVGSIIAIIILLNYTHKKQKRKAMNDLLKYFSESGTQNTLNFSGQEVLNNGVLGLDGVHRKILVVTREENINTSFIIDLNEVKECTVKKVFGSVKGGDTKGQKPEPYLEKIILHFTMNNKPPIEIAFYENLHNHIYEANELEQKAKDWEQILSKMQKPLKLIA